MSILHKAAQQTETVKIIAFDVLDSTNPMNLSVRLEDGRGIIVPLWWFPRLAGVGKRALELAEVFPHGIHWEALGEAIPVESFTKGIPDTSPWAKAWRSEHGYSNFDERAEERVQELRESQYGVREAAELLGVSRQRIHALIQAGRLSATKLGTDYVITLRDLQCVGERKNGRPRKRQEPQVPSVVALL